MSDAKSEVESQGSQEAQEDFKSEFPPSNPFTRLPPEITLMVLESVGPTDLGKVSQTCAQLRTRAEDEKLWSGKCTEEGFQKDILNSTDLQILADRSSKDKSFKPSQSKANFSKHFTRERNLTRNQIREPIVLEASGGSLIYRSLEITDNRIIDGRGNTVKVWCSFSGSLLLTLAEHTSTVLTVQMSEEFITSGSQDDTLKVWSSTTGACLRTLRGHTGSLLCSHLRGDILVSGSSDKEVRVWDVREGTCLNILKGHQDWVRCVQFNGSVVASGGINSVIKIWNPDTASCLLTLRGHSGTVEEIMFYGDLLVSASRDKTVKVWDTNTGESLHNISPVSPGSWYIYTGNNIALEENILVTKHQDNTAKMWNILTGTCLFTFAGTHKHTHPITSVHVDSKFVVTASEDGSIKLWNIKSGQFIRNLLELEEGGKVLDMKMEDAKIVALTQKASDEREIIVLNFDIEYEDSGISKKSPEEEVHPEQSVIESSTMTSSFFSAFSKVGMTKSMSSGGERGKVEEGEGKKEDGGSEAVEGQEDSSSSSTSSFFSDLSKIGLTSREEKEDKVEEKKDEDKTEDTQDEKDDSTKLQ